MKLAQGRLLANRSGGCNPLLPGLAWQHVCPCPLRPSSLHALWVFTSHTSHVKRLRCRGLWQTPASHLDHSPPRVRGPSSDPSPETSPDHQTTSAIRVVSAGFVCPREEWVLFLSKRRGEHIRGKYPVFRITLKSLIGAPIGIWGSVGPARHFCLHH